MNIPIYSISKLEAGMFKENYIKLQKLYPNISLNSMAAKLCMPFKIKPYFSASTTSTKPNYSQR